MRPRLIVATILGSFLGLVGGASAQPVVSAFPPSFHTLDRVDGRSLAGVDVGLSSFDGASAQRFGFYGQGVSEMGLGAYGAIAFSNLSITGADSVSGLGNLEAGGIFALRNLLTMRLGLVLPTSSQDGMMAGILGGYVRLTDLVQSSHETTWLRFSISPILRSGTFFMRADLGIDVPVSQPSGSDIDPIVRGNLGVGWDLGMFAVTGELVNIGTTGSGYSMSERFEHTFAIGGRLILGGWQPSLALVFPLDSGPRDAGLNVAVLAGVQYVIF